jgi:hypothetical protein
MPRIVCVRSPSLPTTTPTAATSSNPVAQAICISLPHSPIPVIPCRIPVQKLHPTSIRAPGPICQNYRSTSSVSLAVPPIRGHHHHFPSNSSTIRMVSASSINRSDRPRRSVTNISHPGTLLPDLIRDLRKSRNCIRVHPHSSPAIPDGSVLGGCHQTHNLLWEEGPDS